MTLNVDELQVSSLSVGQSVQVTADAVPDKTYTGVVTRVSMKGTSNGGTTTYPVKVRIDETDGLRPGMNANAEIVVAQAKNTLTVPNAAIVRGGYVLVTQDSPSAVNADPGMIAPDGYVYVPVKTGVSDDNYTQIVSGLTGNDTVAYDSAAASTDTYYDDGGYYEADAEGTEGEEGADAANSMVDEAEPENGTVPAEEPVEARKSRLRRGCRESVSGRRRGLSGLTQEECMSALIEFDEVCKYYQMGDTTVKAADHITMKIEKGEFVAIVGQSGSGKSTCMNIIGCLDVPPTAPTA